MENLQGGTLALEHRYEVLERCDRHGYITVFRGRQDPFGKDIWIKAYHGLEGIDGGEEVCNRLKKATRRASMLHSTGILRVIDYGELRAGVPFVVSERCEGESLAEVLEREGTLSVEQTATLLLRLAEVLEPIHRGGLAHGELDARWVYICDGRMDAAMLDHAGVALHVDEVPADDDPSAGAQMLSALAPECLDRGPNTEQAPPDASHAAADVWAMGILAYTALVGVHPFIEEQMAPDDIVKRIQAANPRPLHELGIERPLAEVVETALEATPGERPDSPSIFARLFEEAAGMASTPLPSSSPGEEDTEEEPAPSKPPLDAPNERPPGPADHLITVALLLFLLSNLAWLFYVASP